MFDQYIQSSPMNTPLLWLSDHLQKHTAKSSQMKVKMIWSISKINYFVGGFWNSPVLWAKRGSRSDGDIFVKNCPNLTDSLCTGGFWLWICHLWEAPNRPSRYCLGKVGAFLSFLRPLLFIIIEHLTAIKSEPPTVQISSPVFLDLMENNKIDDQEGICSHLIFCIFESQNIR